MIELLYGLVPGGTVAELLLCHCMTPALHLCLRSKDTFERFQMDEFSLTCRNLGVLRAVRVFSDGRSSKPTWHLDRIVITTPTGEHYFFVYQDWLGVRLLGQTLLKDGPNYLPEATCLAFGADCPPLMFMHSGWQATGGAPGFLAGPLVVSTHLQGGLWKG